MKKIILSIAILFLGSAAFAQKTNDLVDKYIHVKNALVNSDAQNAATAINTFYGAVKNSADFAQKNELLKSTEKLSKAKGIDKQRAVFNDVSIAMWKLVKSADNIDQSLYYQYCPMKKSYWLSYEKEIKNPYYGAAMLHCGSVAETKNL